MSTTDPINDRIANALAALLDWGRENTSPRDPNSPHALLVEAAAALEARKAALCPNASAHALLRKSVAQRIFANHMYNLPSDIRHKLSQADLNERWADMVCRWQDSGKISAATANDWLATGPH
jgi:hypothetical protein